MLADATQTPDSSIFVVVNDASSAGPILDWSLHQALRRDSRIKVLYVPTFPHADDGRIIDLETAELGRKELAATLGRLGGPYRASVETRGPGQSTIEAIRDKAVSDGMTSSWSAR